MMDYIHGLGEAPQATAEATSLGRATFHYLDSRSPAKSGVRHRRRLLAGLIDRIANRGGKRVLAIAAGHVREVELSDAVQRGKLDEFVALDQDEASLSVVARDYAHLGIRTINGLIQPVEPPTVPDGHPQLLIRGLGFLAQPQHGSAQRAAADLET